MITANNEPVEYEYTGRAVIAFDDHHDEYEVDFEKGDRFTVCIKKNEVYIVHKDVPKLTFKAAFTDKKYLRLMKSSKPTQFQFLPHPKHPCYPLIDHVSMDIVPTLYAYFNDKLFNHGCPKNVVFKATTSNAKTAGLAEFATRSEGKRSYRLSLRMDRIKHDPFLFVDVLIHEMIHLYVFRQYAETRDRNLIADPHGQAFQDHVDRINKFGFHINTYLDWETRKTLATAKDYYVIVAHLEGVEHKAMFWSLIKPSVLELDNLLDEVRAHEPGYRMRMVCYSTSSPDYRTKGLELTKNFKLGKKVVSFYLPKLGDDLVTVLQTQVKDPAAVDKHAKIKLNKRDMPYLLLPYDDYYNACRSGQAYHYGNAEAAWMNVPLKAIEEYARSQLKDAHKAIRMGMKPAEVSSRLSVIPTLFMPRINHRVYSQSVKTIIKTEKLQGLENYPELDL